MEKTPAFAASFIAALKFNISVVFVNWIVAKIGAGHRFWQSHRHAIGMPALQYIAAASCH